MLPPTQSRIVELFVRLSGTQEFSTALLGVILFPYVIITLALSKWLYKQQKSALGEVSAAIALVFGIVLTGLSAIVSVRPLARSDRPLEAIVLKFLEALRREQTFLSEGPVVTAQSSPIGFAIQGSYVPQD
jgi:hypothetical protein